ncbi:MAG: DUF4340 domain-containing protein [Firmicutes bacterium]|nr:DUF4340 domain-containing protein [Bacillota bacterium]
MAKQRIQSEIRLIIILAILSAVFFGLYFGISAISGHKEDNTQVLIDKAVMDEIPVSIEVMREDGSFELLKKDTGWLLDEDPELPISNLRVTEIRTVLKYFSAGRIIEDAGSMFGTFGLDKPEATVKLTAEGKEKTYLVGDYNPVTAEYYVSLENDDTVYLIPGTDGASLIRPLKDYVDDPAVSGLSISEIAGLRIEKGSFTADIDYEDSRYVVSTMMSSYETSRQTVMQILDCFAQGAYRCVAIDPSKEEVVGYGLDDPEISISFVRLDNEEYDLKIGEDRDGNCYICQNGTKVIYSFDRQRFDTLAETIETGLN